MNTISNHKKAKENTMVEFTQDKIPEKWDGLFPEKENSAWAGAVQKVKKDNLTKGSVNPEEGLSVTDHIITKDEFANLLKEIFPKAFFYTHNGKEKIGHFNPRTH